MANYRQVIVAVGPTEEDERFVFEMAAGRMVKRVKSIDTFEKLEALTLSQDDLLIISTNFLSESPFAGDGSAGLLWIRDRHQQPNPAPTIVFTKDHNLYQSVLPDIELCRCMTSGKATGVVYTQVLSALADALAKTRDRLPTTPKYAVIDVSVSMKQNAIQFKTASYTTLGTLTFSENAGPDIVDLDNLETIIKESKDLGSFLSIHMRSRAAWLDAAMVWQARYKELGSKIHAWLLTPGFRSALALAYRETGPASADQGRRVVLRFKLERETYDACWEALYGPRHGTISAQEYFFRDHTIARRIANDGTETKLKIPDGVVNVLLIDANLAGGVPLDCSADPALENYIERVKPEFPSLASKAEVDALQKQSAPERSPYGLAFDTLPERTDDGEPFDLWQEVQDKLKAACDGGKPYDVVHFVGHGIAWDDVARSRNGDILLDSYGNSIPVDKSYLLFPGRLTNQPVTAAGFARVLGEYGVQLAYLSCCRGSAGKIAYEIGTRGVPLAIGFTWDVYDNHAAAFAERFYIRLLKENFRVCTAYDAARRDVQAHYENEPIWACPVLIAQPDEWASIQTSLRA
jgi:hypothetical protein